ncbi:ribonuclease Oy-like [Belonocnema kinseyi]|uniref:ribonuclease Oy-like n=1 Tax=Belonocnema kinseyi TaxID=2817044 RepID=UPI00143D2FFF|nr:ribonuclease Oy-like [Belonocnema kinseyi]
MVLLNCCKYLLFLGLMVQFSNGNPRYQGNNYYSKSSNADNSKGFDIIIFTQSWPKTVCSQWMKKSPAHHCNMPKTATWSIHGLWPSQYHKMGPESCDNSLSFDPRALHNIRKELLVKWMDVHGERPESFWEHEYTKHGTCAAVLTSMNSEEKYFQTALDLFDKYPMKNVLAQANITPGRNYPVQKILDGVKNVLGKNAQVTCDKHPETQDQTIMEIRICFDKKLNLTDCDGILAFPTNCDRKIDVTY